MLEYTARPDSHKAYCPVFLFALFKGIQIFIHDKEAMDHVYMILPFVKLL